MHKIVSHTLVNNGQPFIGKVLEQVIPFMDKCVITVSMRSNDGTLEVINELAYKYPDKLNIGFEKVKTPSHLTYSRQEMVYREPSEWILFLDDDDYWPTDSLKSMLGLLDQDVPGFIFSPFQVISKTQFDASWKSSKWFTKLFKNKDINYRGHWPRDLIFTGNKPLYWRHNDKVVIKKDIPFYHLALVKKSSFRNNKKLYKQTRVTMGDIYKPMPFKEEQLKIVEEIFNEIA
jgi:glycosyltransferase involved in cell wall biosynthesis